MFKQKLLRIDKGEKNEFFLEREFTRRFKAKSY